MADKFTMPKFEDYFFKLASDNNDIKKILEGDGEIGSHSFGGGAYNNYASAFGVSDDVVTSNDLFGDTVETPKQQSRVAKEVKKAVKVAEKLPVKQPIKKIAKLTTSDLFDSTPSEYMHNILGDSDDPVALFMKGDALRQEAEQQGGMIKEASNTLGFDTLEAVGVEDVVVDELGYEWTAPKFEDTSGITHTASKRRSSGGGGGGESRASQAELVQAGFKPFEHIGGGYSVGVSRGDSGPLSATSVRDKLMNDDNGDPDNLFIDKRDLHQGDDMFGSSSPAFNNYGGSNDSRMSFTNNAINSQGGIVAGGGGVSQGIPVNNRPQNTSEINNIAKTKINVNRFKVL